jgi:hypothetical protein
MQAPFVVDLLGALGRIGADDLARNALETLLARPQAFGMDAVLLPAVLDLAGQIQLRRWEAMQPLIAACLEHLRRRIAEPLAPPTDWTREATFRCRCNYCTELGRFLRAPDQREWSLKSAEANRQHVEHIVRQAHCDLDLTTDRRGRPYRLVCTKNQASYERRSVQRRQDLDACAHLEAAGE